MTNTEPIFIINSKSHDGVINKMLFTIDGQELISIGEDKAISFGDVETGQCADVLHNEIIPDRLMCGMIYATDLSHDGRHLAVGGIPNAWGIRIIDLNERQVVRTCIGSNATINCISLSADGRWLAAGEYYGNIKLWNCLDFDEGQPGAVETPCQGLLKAHQNIVYGVGFSADGERRL